jgi:arylsulfatase A-like enzyme
MRAMNRLWRWCLIFAAIAALAARAEDQPSRPNFILLLVDDLRWNTLGFMGDRAVQTPHLDRLAKQAVVFRNAFVTTSICCVSRASILTGQWEKRHRIVGFDTPLSPAQWAETYPALLRKAGYRTGFVGKFGVGAAKHVAAMSEAFDFWRGRPGQGGDFFEKNDPARTHATARFGNEALDFLASCNAEQPFCLSVSFNAVHARDGQPREFEPDPRDEALYAGTDLPVPPLATDAAFQRLPAFVQASEGRRRWKMRFDTPEKAQQIIRDYYRLITGVDREVGRLVEELEKRGLAHNTVILFTSDNGFALGDRGMADKWFAYEEDIRVPLFIYDPRQASRTVDALVLNVDLAPTMLELARLPIPEAVQGRSLFQHLRGEQPAAEWRTDFFYEHHSVPAKIPPVEGIRTARWKYIRWLPGAGHPEPVEELYDLQGDPLEERNLVGEAGHEKTLHELRERWQRGVE